jgi:hypothetical protein
MPGRTGAISWRARAATPGTVHAGGPLIKVMWLMITDLGRWAFAGT